MSTYLQLVLTSFFWAATFHFGKYAVALMPPLAVGIWRFLLGGLALVPIVLLREPLHFGNLRRNLLPLLAMGVIGIGGFNLGMFYGLKRTSALNAALIMAFMPAMIVALAAWLQRERIGWVRGIGMGLGLAGVIVVVSGGSWRTLVGLSFSRGDLLLLAASACWALYSVIPGRFVRGLGPLQIAGSTIVIGTLAMLGFALLALPAALVWPPLPAWPALAFMGVCATAVAYLWWTRGVGRVGAQRAALFMNLTPVLTALIGTALGEPTSGAQVAGAVLVIAGLLFAARGAAAR